MPQVPRAPAPHPAYTALVEGGRIPTDPGVLGEMTEEERQAIGVFSRLSRPAPRQPAPSARKTLDP